MTPCTYDPPIDPGDPEDRCPACGSTYVSIAQDDSDGLWYGRCYDCGKWFNPATGEVDDE